MNKTAPEVEVNVPEPAAEPGVPIPVDLLVMLPARLHREPDGGFSADVPALPGCFTHGGTIEEAIANLKEAAEGWLLASQDLALKGWPKS